MIGTSQLINAFSRPCFTDTTDIFKDGSGVALYGLDYDASGGGSGKFGDAAIFNGSSSKIVTGLTLPADSSMSFSLWFKTATTGVNQSLFGEADSNFSNLSIRIGLWWANDNNIYVWIANGSSQWYSFIAGVSYLDGNWHNFVLSINGTSVKLYADGSQTPIIDATSSVSFGTAGVTPLTIGAPGSAYSGYFWTGSVDQVRIFNTALTPSQVTQLYQENNSTVGTHLFGCIANYNLDGSAKESMGTTAYDGTETDITYTYDGTPTAVDFGVGGKTNYGARFNGSSSKITLPSGFLDSSTTLSFSIWVNPSSFVNFTGILDKYVGSTSGWALDVPSSTNRLPRIVVYDGANKDVIATTALTLGSWTHIVGTISTSEMKIYVNGSLEGTTSISTLTTNTTPVVIGGDGVSTFAFNGNIDQVRVFNKALSSAEVGKLYGNGAGEIACKYTATTTNVNYPVTNTAYYKLDNSAIDETGSYNGTETNIEYRFGRYGQAAVFNGSSSIITATQPSGLNGPCTYSAWLKTTSSSYQSIITVGSVTGSHTAGVNLFVNSGKLSCQTGNGSNVENSNVNSTSNINTGNWVHCAVVVAGSTQGSSIKVYVNGEEEGSGTANNTAIVAASSESLCLGGRILSGSQSTFLNGSLDQVRIYSSALSASQVTQLYNEKPEVDTSNFKAVLYEGNGGTNFISNVGFQPDLVWVKARDDAHDHVLYDTVRGVGSGKALSSNATYAQGAYDAAYGFLDTFEATGFVAKTGSSFANYTNKNNESYAAWCWKGGGEAVQNNDGTIQGANCIVSANTEAGFSIVKYTGDNSVSATVGHGLSDAEMIILKDLTVGTNQWRVWHKDLTASNWIYLSLSLAQVTAATDGGIRYVDSNTFGFINGTTAGVEGVNYTSSQYIAYVWKSISGYSKIGSYNGLGTSAVTETGLGFKPSWVLIKNITNSANWNIYDSRIAGSDVANFIAYPNLSNSIISGSHTVTMQTDGFQVSATDHLQNNKSGNTYIYMAFK